MIFLDQGHIALAERTVEKAAYYEELLQRPDIKERKDGATLQDELSREYYLMRVVLVLAATRQPSIAPLTRVRRGVEIIWILQKIGLPSSMLLRIY